MSSKYLTFRSDSSPMVNATTFIIFLIFLNGFSSNTMAESSSFGRLFTAADERGQLDIYRYRRDMEEAREPLKNNATTEKNKTHLGSIKNRKILSTKNKSIKLSGLVIRSDGKQTVWVNGKSHSPGLRSGSKGYAFDSAVISLDNSVMLSLKNRQKRLKTGQVWVSFEDKVLEGFEKRKSNSLVGDNKLYSVSEISEAGFIPFSDNPKENSLQLKRHP